MTQEEAPDRLRVRAVNFEPVLGERQATADRIKLGIEDAARDHCDLVVFPEMALQGFVMCQACLDGRHACETHLSEGELAAGPHVRLGDLGQVLRGLAVPVLREQRQP